MRLGEFHAIGWGNPCPYLGGNRRSDIALQDEDVTHLAMILLGPYVSVRNRINKMGGDAHLVTGTQYASFDKRVNIQISANVRSTNVCVLIAHDRSSGCHSQRADLRQLGSQFVGQTIAEIVLCRISRKVTQRQHRDRLYIGRRPAENPVFVTESEQACSYEANRDDGADAGV